MLLQTICGDDLLPRMIFHSNVIFADATIVIGKNLNKFLLFTTKWQTKDEKEWINICVRVIPNVTRITKQIKSSAS